MSGAPGAVFLEPGFGRRGDAGEAVGLLVETIDGRVIICGGLGTGLMRLAQPIGGRNCAGREGGHDAGADQSSAERGRQTT